MAIQVDPNEIQEQGYIVLRNVIPPAQLDSLRTSYETLVDRQREIWARDRGPDDPPGGAWETHHQPRLVFNELVDESTADTLDFLLAEPWSASRQLLRGRDIGLHAMFLMCSPVSDRGPASWHRDTSATFDAPLQGLELDMEANGPGYVQWNVPLYDDNVLWVVPGSHRRPNTEEENRQLAEDPRQPLPGGIPVELNAGDAVVYTNFILHWGSNYSSNLRRTIHFGYQSFGGPLYRYYHLWWDVEFAKSLPAHIRKRFEHWDRLIIEEHDKIESIFRAILDRDADAFLARLAALHPGQTGRMVTAILLCKLASSVLYLKRTEVAGAPKKDGGDFTDLRPPVLHLYQDMSRRFSLDDIELLWKRFSVLDQRLRSDGPQLIAGTQAKSAEYRVYEMPENFSLESFIASW